jgi:hypothetical protein
LIGGDVGFDHKTAKKQGGVGSGVGSGVGGGVGFVAWMEDYEMEKNKLCQGKLISVDVGLGAGVEDHETAKNKLC